MSGQVRRKLGVEEEFQLIDLETRRLTPRAPELLSRLPDDGYVDELQQCVVEVNSGVFDTLEGLRADLTRRRQILVDTAAEMGIGVVAAGAVPLTAPQAMGVTETPRYRRMLADYQLLTREQLICGAQFHVDIPDRDEGVRLAHRLEAYLPLFLALSASSPFWADGSDTGYASARTLVWTRWPSTGPFAPVDTAAEYDQLVEDLVASGVITDPGMLYFDLRLSTKAPTLELRTCDSCPSLDTVILIAGLYRAVVERETRLMEAGEPPFRVASTLLRAAQWRAARSGLEGVLVDLTRPAPIPATRAIRWLVGVVRPELEAMGDWDLVSDLCHKVLHAGSSAARQRQALRRRGKLTDVVDMLIAETSGELPSAPQSDGLLAGYGQGPHGAGDTYDEAVAADGRVRAPYREVVDTMARLGPIHLRERQFAAELESGAHGLMFLATGRDRPEVFRTDLLPRIIPAAEWEELAPGLAQRALALNAFIDDVYGARAVMRDGVVPPEVLDRAPGYRQSGIVQAHGRVRAHVIGLDLVSTGAGEWLVIEDNLRVPSGIGFAVASRTLLDRYVPELPRPDGLLDVDGVAAMLYETLLAAAPPHASPRGEAPPAVALLSIGSSDSAWFEHQMLASGMGVPLLRPSDIAVEDGICYRYEGGERHRVDVLYLRMDEDMLLSSAGCDGVPLRAGLLGAVHRDNLTLANALGNGVGDDKAVYAFVPAMIDYYLGEEPLLAQVPTYLCAEREQRDTVLNRLETLVVKPCDGFGGSGITIGSEATDEDLAERRTELVHHPERYIAQEIISLSTHPTFDGTSLVPHHVDLRVFVHLRGHGEDMTAHVVPAALTRVAPLGSLVVNSSRGGGAKDTWILS